MRPRAALRKAAASEESRPSFVQLSKVRKMRKAPATRRFAGEDGGAEGSAAAAAVRGSLDSDIPVVRRLVENGRIPRMTISLILVVGLMKDVAQGGILESVMVGRALVM